MSVQWWLVIGLATLVTALLIAWLVVAVRDAATLRRAFHQGEGTIRIKVRGGGRASARLVVHDDRGVVYRVVARFPGEPMTVTYCPPSTRLLRLHVQRLANDRATRKVTP